MNKEEMVLFEGFSDEVVNIGNTLLTIFKKNISNNIRIWTDLPDKMIVLGTEKNMKGEICYIKPFKDRVNLGFFHATSLNDTSKLLEGTGKNLRHIKVKSINSKNREAIEELISQAIVEHKERNNTEK
jgi:hypothetical protein